MIIVQIMGGLGNQMFQYAAGLALSKRLETNLYLDTSFFDVNRKGGKVTPRHYELGLFGIYPLRFSMIDKLDLKLHSPQIIREHKGVKDEFRTVEGNAILQGYWQSDWYFYDYSNEIRDAFKLDYSLSVPAIKMWEKIKADNRSVSLHFRRGDYVTNKAAADMLGILPLKYYQEAIATLKRKVGDINLYVFSDDIDWCKKNLKLNAGTTFVDQTTSSSEDLKLMAACRHNVIANSSFSWWAGWLNQNRGKIVIAPKKWFANKPDYSSLELPKTWVSL
jgi:hypothetical protein